MAQVFCDWLPLICVHAERQPCRNRSRLIVHGSTLLFFISSLSCYILTQCSIRWSTGCLSSNPQSLRCTRIFILNSSELVLLVETATNPSKVQTLCLWKVKSLPAIWKQPKQLTIWRTRSEASGHELICIEAALALDRSEHWAKKGCGYPSFVIWLEILVFLFERDWRFLSTLKVN